MPEAIINSLSDLRRHARAVAQELSGGDVVALVGELGAGKTAWAQMVAKFLGVHKSVLSPTFTIFKVYPVKRRPFAYVCHVDLFRHTGGPELLGFEEHLADPDSICIIEWADKIKARLPQATRWVKIEPQADGSRVIRW